MSTLQRSASQRKKQFFEVFFSFFISPSKVLIFLIENG
jgi:hypothetical protein